MKDMRNWHPRDEVLRLVKDVVDVTILELQHLRADLDQVQILQAKGEIEEGALIQPLYREIRAVGRRIDHLLYALPFRLRSGRRRLASLLRALFYDREER